VIEKLGPKLEAVWRERLMLLKHASLDGEEAKEKKVYVYSDA
jgi:hypothetical protein